MHKLLYVGGSRHGQFLDTPSSRDVVELFVPSSLPDNMYDANVGLLPQTVKTETYKKTYIVSDGDEYQVMLLEGHKIDFNS